MSKQFKQIKTKDENPSKSGWYHTDEGELYFFNTDDLFTWSCRNDKVSEEYPKFWYKPVNESDGKTVTDLISEVLNIHAKPLHDYATLEMTVKECKTIIEKYATQLKQADNTKELEELKKEKIFWMDTENHSTYQQMKQLLTKQDEQTAYWKSEFESIKQQLSELKQRNGEQEHILKNIIQILDVSSHNPIMLQERIKQIISNPNN